MVQCVEANRPDRPRPTVGAGLGLHEDGPTVGAGLGLHQDGPTVGAGLGLHQDGPDGCARRPAPSQPGRNAPGGIRPGST